MTKQIDFDASLIGQEGITVKYRNGETPLYIHWKKSWEFIPSVSSDGQIQSNYIDGSYYGFGGASRLDLLMYREVKTMTVEEWISKCQHKDIHNMLIEFAAAIKNGEVEI
jgi:hypothetical protein